MGKTEGWKSWLNNEKMKMMMKWGKMWCPVSPFILLSLLTPLKTFDGVSFHFVHFIASAQKKIPHCFPSLCGEHSRWMRDEVRKFKEKPSRWRKNSKQEVCDACIADIGYEKHFKYKWNILRCFWHFWCARGVWAEIFHCFAFYSTPILFPVITID